MTKSPYKCITVTLLLILGVSGGVSVFDNHGNDDWVVEHKVSYEEAIAAAKDLQLPKGPIPGCKSCSYEEMTYCKDGSVISDHCCCDTGYDNLFPFVEHTCLVGRQACTVIAADCAEYERVRECCCHSYLGSVWKYRAGGVDALNPSILLTILVLIFSLLSYL